MRNTSSLVKDWFLGACVLAIISMAFFAMATVLAPSTAYSREGKAVPGQSVSVTGYICVSPEAATDGFHIMNNSHIFENRVERDIAMSEALCIPVNNVSLLFDRVYPSSVELIGPGGPWSVVRLVLPADPEGGWGVDLVFYTVVPTSSIDLDDA